MRIVVSILAVLAIAVAGACYFLTDIVQARVLAALKQHQVPVTSLVVSSVTPTSVTLSDIAIGEDDAVKAKTLTLAYRGGTSLNSLRLNIDAEALNVRASQHEQGWKLGGLERVWQPPDTKLGKKVAAYHFDGAADVIVALADKSLDGDIHIAQFTTHQQGKEIQLRGGHIAPRVSGEAMQVEYDLPNILLQQKSAPLLAPMALKGEAERKGNLLHHESVLRAVGLDFTVDIAGQHDVLSNTGSATLKTPELHFAPGGLTFAALAPGIAADVKTPPLSMQLEDTVTYGKATSMQGTLNVLQMPVGNLIAQALGKGASMEGTLKGTVPFQFIDAKNWKLHDASLSNDGPMKLTLLPMDKQIGGLVNALASALTKQKAPEGALNEVNVSRFVLAASSTDNAGNLRLKGELEGFNPLLKRPVKLNLNLTTNLRDLLRSMAASALQKGTP